jgi:hypothetical protein
MQRSITPADYDALLALDQPTAPAAAPPMAQHLLGALLRPRGGAAMGDCAFCRGSMRADPSEHLRVLPADNAVCHETCVVAAMQVAPFGAVCDPLGNPVFPGLVSASPFRHAHTPCSPSAFSLGSMCSAGSGTTLAIS